MLAWSKLLCAYILGPVHFLCITKREHIFFIRLISIRKFHALFEYVQYFSPPDFPLLNPIPKLEEPVPAYAHTAESTETMTIAQPLS